MCTCLYFLDMVSHWVGGNRKPSKQSTNVDQKLLEIAFSIVICSQSGDKWQPKTLFLTIFIYVVDRINVFDCRPTPCDIVTVKPVLSGHSKRRPKIGFQDRLSLSAGQKYCRMLPFYCRMDSAILSTFIKLP